MWGVLFAAIIVFGGLALAELLAGAAAPGFADGGVAGLALLLTPLPAVLTGLFLAGVLAALFALGQATLFAAATAISHDVFDEIIDKRGPEGRRIVAARLILVAVAAGAAMLVPLWQAEATVLLEWALALAAAGAFAPLVLGLWWRRCNEVGALSGMAAGFGFTTLVFLMDRDVISSTLVSSGWANVGAPTAAIAGLAIAIVVTIGLSLATPAPEAEVQNLVKDTTSGRGGQPIRERPA
jgi:cation/acetate symporter